LAYIIDNEQCIDCRLCIPECPDGGISVVFGADGEYSNSGIYTIDSNKCSECIEFNKKSKCAAMCPVDCIELKNPEIDSVLWQKFNNNKSN